MPAHAVIGAQWGDEGKGKIIDYLAKDTDYVIRYSGGNNAGHTVINKQGKFSLHLVPSGIFWPHVTCVIGNGVVVDADVLIGELDSLSSAGIETSQLLISDRAHLIMPYHVALDRLEEAARGSSAIGTTGRGVGPAYVDKTSRIGVRVGELIDNPSLRERLKQAIDLKNNIITKIHGEAPISIEETYDKCRYWGERLSPQICQTELVIEEALKNGKELLLEGAQGTMLDIDHGTYPYVTSSSPSIGGAFTGLGIAPRDISKVTGVFKAYSTRVGGGPMVSEMIDETADPLREKAWEYGTTTGRGRRIGWFDAVAGNYSARINGFTSLVLTRLDVLDGFPSIKICIGYDLDGELIDYFPSTTNKLNKCRPVYRELDGWRQPTASVTRESDLPKEARAYIECIEELVGSKIGLISTGPERHETINM